MEYPYYDPGLGQVVKSARERKDVMKAKGLVVDGSTESEKHRTERLAEQINIDRNKKGLKSKTIQELVGNTRRVPKKIFFFT